MYVATKASTLKNSSLKILKNLSNCINSVVIKTSVKMFFSTKENLYKKEPKIKNAYCKIKTKKFEWYIQNLKNVNKINIIDFMLI